MRPGETEWSIRGGTWARHYRGALLTLARTLGASESFTAYVNGVSVPGRWHTIREAKRRAERAAVKRAESLSLCHRCATRRTERGAKLCTPCAELLCTPDVVALSGGE